MNLSLLEHVRAAHKSYLPSGVAFAAVGLALALSLTRVSTPPDAEATPSLRGDDRAPGMGSGVVFYTTGQMLEIDTSTCHPETSFAGHSK
jgi:hypothetical protein